MSLQDIFSLSQFNTECLQIAQTMFIQGLRVYSLVCMVQRVANSSGFRPRPAMHDITLKSKGLKYDKETKLKVQRVVDNWLVAMVY